MAFHRVGTAVDPNRAKGPGLREPVKVRPAPAPQSGQIIAAPGDDWSVNVCVMVAPALNLPLRWSG